ncbi:MAG: molybdenum cofactor biosynthesis protein MoaE [Nevskiaceae bacterium]|nr:MAG: molybdenum cofactor biosynthesis protein MoaE [Nevskiaceae bacterium]TBR74255.1 MAG: molybdenum cofactor biosynthesis protein MoaE [Nevskiaceae bacterium]
MTSHITTAPIDVGALMATTEDPEAGALVVFAGTVRQHNDGKKVTSINYSAYIPLAEKSIAEIAARARRDHDIQCCEIRHRIGDMAVGDISVLVVVRAEHRGEAFAAGRYAIDIVKHEVPIWKYETYEDGTHEYVKGCPLHHEHPSNRHVAHADAGAGCSPSPTR